MAEEKTQNESKDSSADSSQSSINSLPWVAGAVLLLGLAVAAGLYRSSTVKVGEVQFSGNRFISDQELANIEVPAGISADSVNFMEVMKRFEQIPYVKRADISVEPSGRLSIRITERQPVALLVDGNRKVYIDQDGLQLQVRPGKTVDVPLLYGFRASVIGDTLQSESFKTAANFLTTLRSRAVSDATISEVAWAPERGVVVLTNQNGVKLIFGKSDFTTRLRNWEAFYGEVIKQKGIEQMWSVDLRFEGQIVTREE